MAHTISSDCTSCGACAAACPVEAISEGSEHYEINPDTCTDCAECVENCPVDAISPA
jgi:ferredoxin